MCLFLPVKVPILLANQRSFVGSSECVPGDLTLPSLMQYSCSALMLLVRRQEGHLVEMAQSLVDAELWLKDSFGFGFGQRSFAVTGPKAWNSLPSELRCIAVDSTFRLRLKAELFSRAYGVSINI